MLRKLGLESENPGAFCGEWLGSGRVLKSVSPIDGKVLATIRTATSEQYERTVQRAQAAFQEWQKVHAPSRGELVRLLGELCGRYRETHGERVRIGTDMTVASPRGARRLSVYFTFD